MSHIINVDFNAHRVVSQEMTILNVVPGFRGMVNKRPRRTRKQVWEELLPLRMTGPEDDVKRRRLIAELRRFDGPLDWNGPKGAA